MIPAGILCPASQFGRVSSRLSLFQEQDSIVAACATSALRKRLGEEGKLCLDLLHRFGEDLLETVVLLEREGIAHCDIKPDNIGVALGGKDSALHLVLFDFSLSRCSPENIRAGAPGYLAPFLPLRKPPRWDLQAERFSAGVTLYQMATGDLPIWRESTCLYASRCLRRWRNAPACCFAGSIACRDDGLRSVAAGRVEAQLPGGGSPEPCRGASRQG